MKEAESNWWVEGLRDSVEPWELEELFDPTMREDAFSRTVSFGTGGIRARMGVGPNRLNRFTVARITRGLASYLLSSCARTPKVVIAYDTRIHSCEFAQIAASALVASGIEVNLFKEPQPTPVLGFAVRYLQADAGIVITASHNPMEYNGYKVYGPTGCQATDELAQAVQSEIKTIDTFTMDLADLSISTSKGLFSWVPKTVYQSYLEAVITQRVGVSCEGIRVAYSPLNGTGAKPALELLKRLEVDCLTVGEQLVPNGAFPTCPKPNPELPEAMSSVMELAVDKNCDVAVANDPDADRIGVAACHRGQMRLLSGDEVGLLLLDFLCQVLPFVDDQMVITTIVSSPLFDDLAAANHMRLLRTLTGFKYIGEQLDMLHADEHEDAFLIGLEESCGYLRGTYVRDKDGIVALMLVCELVAWHKRQGRDLVEALDYLYGRYGYIVGRQLSVELPGRAGREKIAQIMDDLKTHPPVKLGNLDVRDVVDYAHGVSMPGDDKQTLPAAYVVEFVLSDGCKVIVRPSGTEPKAKAYCFARSGSAKEARERLDGMCDAVTLLLRTDKERNMAADFTNVVLLSGGSGVRLWPLSNGSRSKQFLKVLRSDDGGRESMVQRTTRLVKQENPNASITVATSAAQIEALKMQMSGTYSLSIEPERRDTAPAIMLACAHVAWEQGKSADSTIVVMPIDTYADPAYYSNVARLEEAVRAGVADLTLLGVRPSYPSQKYGYIVPVNAGDSSVSALPVSRFVEKPSEAVAADLISEGALWNCGVFAFRLGWMLELIGRYCDAHSYAELRARYSELPRNSFDYEVVERADSVAVLPYAGAWKDLGTWNTLCDELAEPVSGKVWLDERSTHGVHVVNETRVPVVVAGLSDAVVAATPDGILVSGKEQSAQIKDLVAEASTGRPMYERKIWGEYRIIDKGDCQNGSHALTKELVISPGCQLAYKKHANRTETWVVTEGSGEAVIDGKVQPLRIGDTVRIAPGEVHAARANTELHILEVQVGWPVTEDDAEELGTYWE